MGLAAGTMLGPYEITAKLGAGGMGEVYRAVDTRLERTVAIKVLPSHIARDDRLRERFNREAKTLGLLSHPRICPIHDVGSAQGTDYLVMEFLHGETLADRLQSGALPLDSAVKIGIEIADALDTAHRAGIVHRDLKPANVMLTKGGATLLDFGLAKTGTVMDARLSTLPTAPDLTIEGTILGTVPYMAPEQLEGREADARSDVFAFGATLFEMITGRRAFEGKTQANLISAVLRDSAPSISTTLAASGGRGAEVDLLHLDHIVRRCLAKDPADRWQSARDVMLHLQWIAEGGARAESRQPTIVLNRRRNVVAWTVASVGLAAAVGFGMLAFQRVGAVASPVVRFSIDAPRETVFAPTNSISAPHPVISPDGRQVAFLAQAGTEAIRLWIRPLDALDARALPGTDGAAFPFWSADGSALGFFAEGALKTIDASGTGAAHRVCDAPAGEGGTWNRDGTVLFAPGPNTGLHRVAASGGASTPVTIPSPARGSAPHRWPSFLPDGRRFVFHEGDGIWLGSLDSPDVRPLTKADSQAVYSATGHLLFMRGTTLVAQAFDDRSGVLSGDPRPIAEGVSRALSNAAFSVSPTGTLIYRSGRLVNRQLTWFDRAGTRLASVGGVHDFNGAVLSPDEQRVAYHRHDGRPDGDLWLVDVARGAGDRLTHTAENNTPVWSPDGTRIAYSSNRDSSVTNLWITSTDSSSGGAPLLSSNVNKIPRSWSPDGTLLAYEAVGARGDIWIVPVAGDRKPFPFLQTEFDEREPAFSPDGRWLAYRSDESGRNEIYLRAFPKGDGRTVVSTNGGATPRWRADGRELFLLVNREIWAVDITPTATGVQVGEPHRLFDIGVGSAGWDVTRDGQRFIVGHGVDDHAPGTLTVTINWAATLRD